MVAYSFKARFGDPIVTLEKRQTVRGSRKRHARPGEPMQLYQAMRTKHCRKLLDIDPICRDVRDIKIIICAAHPELVAAIRIEGVALDDGAIETFAWDDGFRPDAPDLSARLDMGRFWLRAHGEAIFQGVVLRWDPVQ